MKKLLMFMALAIVIAGCARVPAGYKGVRVKTLGDTADKGSIVEVPVGLYLSYPGVEYYKFPIFNQTYVWTQASTEGSKTDESFTFSVNGLPINVDIGIQYSVIDGKIAELFTKYRRGVDELTDVVIRNAVRDGFNKFSTKYDIDTLMTGGMPQLLKDVEQYVRETFENDGINIITLSLVNAPRYPSSIVQAIEEKNRATQRAIQRENELREIEAEAKKKIEFARGEYEAAKYQAKANKELSISYSPTLINKMWIEKWNGELPTTMAGNNGTVLVTPKQ